MRKPDFSFEKKLWEKGYGVVLGLDEVGRGAFAGPIVAGAVVFAPAPQIKNEKLKMQNWENEILSLGVNDSKLLKPREREKLATEIKKYALVWDVTEVGVSVIDRIGIGKATEKAMRKAIRDVMKKLSNKVNKERKQSKKITNYFLLVDGFHVKYLAGGLKRQKAVKGGDRKSLSIAAASILAKVYRDKLMQSLSKKSGCRKYGWGRNKGYGTKEHQKAILRYGLTRYHRKEFVKSWLEKNK